LKHPFFTCIVLTKTDNWATADFLPKGCPSLYPSYLPYKSQHIILNTAQRILEESCFEFAEKWLPSVLSSHGWDCPEAVELTEWTWMLPKRAAELPPHALKLKGTMLKESLLATNKLRHTAVHRLQTIRSAQLEDLHCEIDSKIKAMELNKMSLRTASQLSCARFVASARISTVARNN
jgi:hypothetical protein